MKHRNLEKLNLAIAAAIMLAGSALPAKAGSMSGNDIQVTDGSDCTIAQRRNGNHCMGLNDLFSDGGPSGRSPSDSSPFDSFPVGSAG